MGDISNYKIPKDVLRRQEEARKHADVRRNSEMKERDNASPSATKEDER